MIKAINHDEYLIRKEAARSLKKVGDERAVDPLIMSLKYEKGEFHTHLNTVREYSAEALGIIDDKRALKPLIKTMKEDIDDDVRWKSAWALGKIDDERGVKPLINVLNDNDDDVSRSVIDAREKWVNWHSHPSWSYLKG